MKILIAGDIVPINSNENIFQKEIAKDCFLGFEALFNEADLFIANLECPLTSANQKALKSGSSIKAKPDAINGIENLNINLLSIANNHIGDYGDKGVSDTIGQLNKFKLNFLGAGENPIKARQPYVYTAQGKTVGVLSYADYEFGMVNEYQSGANPFDAINVFEDITSIKTKVDYVIVLLHDGKEYYHYPSPQLQKIGKYLIDLGADIVVCQHSHVVGAVENYKSGTIVYGQGNFLFDYRNNRKKNWSQGFFISINLKDDTNIEFIPFKQNYPGISKLSKEEETVFFNDFKERQEKVKDKDFINKSWAEFITKQSPIYLSSAFGHNTFIARVLKKTGLYKYVITQKTAMIVLNFLRSRVHRESFVSVLEDKLKIEK